jgi:hypothetical protein
MKLGQIVTAKEDYSPLYKKGDKFRIVKINKDSNLTQIEAMRLKDKNVYGFDKNELEEE